MKEKNNEPSRLNLFVRLFINFSCIISCILLIVSISFMLYQKDESEKSLFKSIEQLSVNNAQNISQAINQIERAILSLNNENSGLRERILLYNGDSQSLVTSFEQTVDLLNNYMSIALQSFTENYHVYLFIDPNWEISNHLSVTDIETPSLDGRSWLYSNSKVADEDWYHLANDFTEQNHWFILESEKETLYLARCLQHLTIDNGIVKKISLGVLVIKMDTSWIRKNLTRDNQAEETVFFLVDDAYNLLYTSTNLSNVDAIIKDIIEKTSANHTINNVEYSTTVKRISSELNLITLIPTSQFYLNYLQTIFPLAYFLPVFLMIGFACSIILSRKMTKDILHLAHHMRTNKLTLIEPIQTLRDSDIKLLYDNYNLLITNVNQLLEQNIKYMEYQKEMDLNLLQAQINPHFLCNSLTSVYNLAMIHEENEIAAALSGLTSYLRYNISSPNQDVSLQDELDVLDKYIAVQNFLYGDCILEDYNMDAIDPQKTKIPKMLLQPLIENCIMHNESNEFIEIYITCDIKPGVFSIYVKDNGNIKDANFINDKLNNKDSTPEPKQKTHGYGICNVHQRIQMKYGRQYGLHYTIAEEGGMIATINLPEYLVVCKTNY